MLGPKCSWGGGGTSAWVVDCSGGSLGLMVFAVAV
jgi:hypothetical protein